MSTKIYDAYRLQPGADVFTLRREAMVQLAPLVMTRAVEELVTTAVHAFDGLVARDKTRTFAEVLRGGLQAFNADADNVLRSAQIVALQNAVRDEIYIKCYGGLTQLPANALLGLPTVAESFNYWDNSDGPDNMTEAAWADRAQAWDEAFEDGYDSVSSQGVTVNLFSPYRAEVNFTRVLDLWDALRFPSFEQRVNRLGLDLYLTQYVADNDLQGSTRMVYEISRQMNAWARGEVAATTRASYTTRATLLLPREIVLTCPAGERTFS